jgi:hypothetical protein
MIERSYVYYFLLFYDYKYLGRGPYLKITGERVMAVRMIFIFTSFHLPITTYSID